MVQIHVVPLKEGRKHLKIDDDLPWFPGVDRSPSTRDTESKKPTGSGRLLMRHEEKQLDKIVIQQHSDVPSHLVDFL